MKYVMRFTRCRALAVLLATVLTTAAFLPATPVYATPHTVEGVAAVGEDAVGDAARSIGSAPVYGEPSEWAAREVARAREYGLIPDGMYHSFTANMTRAEFCALAMALYAKTTGEPLRSGLSVSFSDTDDAAILNAHALGIVNGTGGGLFSPNDDITRQEIAVMLYNTIGAIEKAVGRDILRDAQPPLTFSDRYQMDGWAVKAVEALRNNEIMLGVDANRFEPLGYTTKEMGFILVERIYLIYAGLDARKAFPAAYTGEILMWFKGHFQTDGAYSVVGDVHEPYPDITLAELSAYLDGEPFIHDAGTAYYIDGAESLRVSVAAGYPGSTSGTHYPVYVLVLRDDPRERLYLADIGGEFRAYRDEELGEPLTLRTFSDVTFEVEGDTGIYLGGSYADFVASGFSQPLIPASAADLGPEAGPSFTYAELQRDAPELLGQYLWRVRLSRGGIIRLTALTVY